MTLVLKIEANFQRLIKTSRCFYLVSLVRSKLIMKVFTILFPKFVAKCALICNFDGPKISKFKMAATGFQAAKPRHAPTVSSSFSMPVGIWGTDRLIVAKSRTSGSSSAL